jgi:hypothetical protein
VVSFPGRSATQRPVRPRGYRFVIADSTRICLSCIDRERHSVHRGTNAPFPRLDGTDALDSVGFAATRRWFAGEV